MTLPTRTQVLHACKDTAIDLAAGGLLIGSLWVYQRVRVAIAQRASNRNDDDPSSDEILREVYATAPEGSSFASKILTTCQIWVLKVVSVTSLTAGLLLTSRVFLQHLERHSHVDNLLTKFAQGLTKGW